MGWDGMDRWCVLLVIYHLSALFLSDIDHPYCVELTGRRASREGLDARMDIPNGESNGSGPLASLPTAP